MPISRHVIVGKNYETIIKVSGHLFLRYSGYRRPPSLKKRGWGRFNRTGRPTRVLTGIQKSPQAPLFQRGGKNVVSTHGFLAHSTAPTISYTIMMEPLGRPTRTIPMVGTPQIVPSQVCLSCEVCCRFPEPESSFRPYFTDSEIQQAIALGIDASYFSNLAGSQVKGIPNPFGEAICVRPLILKPLIVAFTMSGRSTVGSIPLS